MTRLGNAATLLLCLQSYYKVAVDVNSFTLPVSPKHGNRVAFPVNSNAFVISTPLRHMSNVEESEDDTAISLDEQQAQVGNLVADDEWMGLSMEVSELVRVAVLEDVKSKTSEFLGKEDYKIGDISKELDSRVKNEVAKLRDKDDYELGDLSLALDQMSKDLTCELTGKDDYEFGDLSVEIDRRLKDQAATFCGKDEYEFGDMSKEVDRRVKQGVTEFTGKGDYQFGDISREVETRRQAWVKDTLGEEAASRYQFGDLTKKAVTSFTGKDDYEFGDISKKIMGDLFGKRKRGNQ